MGVAILDTSPHWVHWSQQNARVPPSCGDPGTSAEDEEAAERPWGGFWGCTLLGPLSAAHPLPTWRPVEGIWNPPSVPRPICPGLTLCPLRRKTLQLSRQLRDQAVEAQACYSLGNTYTLLRDYERAAEFHLRHLLIAQELADRWGPRMPTPGTKETWP